MVGWFYKYETVYAERIYEALAERELGDMTPERLQVPEEKIQRYREKALLYREGMSLCALLEIVKKSQNSCRSCVNMRACLKQSY